MADHAATNSGLVLSNGGYDVLRFFVEKGFPGLGVFYATVAAIWHWGYGIEVGGTFAALTVLGGIFLTLARNGYTPSLPEALRGSFDGQVVEHITADGEPSVRLELNANGKQALLNKDVIVFKGLNSQE
jgi:hypothetical protein